MTSKLTSLDAVRGIAAVVVVMHHLVTTFWMDWKAEAHSPGSQLWHHGEFAVRLFFVMSGFVLSLSYFRTFDPAVLRSAAVRRYFRLALPIIGSVALALALHAMGLFSNGTAAAELGRPNGEWLSRYYATEANASDAAREAFFGAYFSYDVGRTYNGVLWTMEAEFKGSLLVFAALALFGRARNRWLLYALGILALYQLRHYALIDFIVGMALCDWWVNANAERPQRWGALAILAGFLIGDIQGPWVREMFVALPRATPLQVDISESIVYLTLLVYPLIATAGALAIILGVLNSERVQRFLTRRAFVVLGKMSFSLYLFHLIAIFSVGTGLYTSLASSGLDHTACALAACAASIVVTFALAAVGAYTLDPWSIRLGRVVDRWLFEPRAAGESGSPNGKSADLSVHLPFRTGKISSTRTLG